jgi:hypothetical protein
MESTPDAAARAFAARRLLREAEATADGGEPALPAGILESIGASEPVVRQRVVAQARALVARLDLPSAEDVADSMVGHLVAARRR